MLYAGFIRKCFRMAILAGIHAEMEIVAEGCVSSSLGLEGKFFRLHTLVAFAAVAGYGERLLVVVAGAAGFSLFHFGHGYRFFLTSDNLAVMAAFALAAGLCNMKVMAESGLSRSLDLI